MNLHMQGMKKSEISLEESKCLLVEMLKYIDSVCRENNLRYSLDFGTLLGAIRHKGFIPWDDDIDLFMLRADYEKFKEVFHSDRYEILTEDTKSWSRQFIRIYDKTTYLVFNNPVEQIPSHGLWIAIFSIDNVPDDKKEWKKMVRDINIWDGFRRIKHSKWTHSGIGRNLVKLFGRILLSPIPALWFNRKTSKVMKRFSDTHTQSRFQRGVRIRVFPSFFFEKYIDVEFERSCFMCIADYDQYLTMLYGDYMTPPPEKERIPKHGYTAYWK